ncbi:hypothetical protein HanIR_Chr17g0894831 [Helianthus annuus]|nr:hypothetical protein HanIR_Chr17g0894831 [Helianthus annuus]
MTSLFSAFTAVVNKKTSFFFGKVDFLGFLVKIFLKKPFVKPSFLCSHNSYKFSFTITLYIYTHKFSLCIRRLSNLWHM